MSETVMFVVALTIAALLLTVAMSWAEWVWSLVSVKEGLLVLGYVMGVAVCSSFGAHALWVVLAEALFLTARHFLSKPPEVTP